MGTTAEALRNDLKNAKARREMPAKRTAQYIGSALLVSIWTWTAFLRHRGFAHSTQFAAAVLVFSAMFGVFWFVAQRFRVALASPDKSADASALGASAFALLAIFLPDYLLGNPPALLRSFLLAGMAALLFLIFLGLAAHRPGWSHAGGGLKPVTVVVVFCVLYFFLTSYLSIRKLYSFGYVGQDLAYFTQCLYTTLHGHLLYSNLYHDLLYSKPVTSDLAGHIQPVLLLFLPFYALHKTAATLLIVRNIFVTLCAWPVYLISRRFLEPWLAVLATLAFLLLPAVLYQNLYDFAPLSLAGFPLLFAFYFYLQSRFVPFIAALVATQMVREDLVFAVFGLGLLAMWQRREARWAITPVALAALWAALSWKLLIPYFLHGASSAVTGCFSYLGSTPGQMAAALIYHPRALFAHENLVYLKHLFEPFGGVLFLGNPVWLLSLPYTGINVLAERGGCNTAMIYRHYSLTPAVLLFVSFLLSLNKLQSRGGDRQLRSAALIFFVLFAALASNVFVTGSEQFNEWRSQPWHREARQVAELVPPDASVAAPRYLLPALANRAQLYQSLRLLEYHSPEPQVIVMDKDWERMEATQQWKENYFLLWQALRESRQYSPVYDSPGYEIYRLCEGCKGELPRVEPRQVVNE
jgi:uncharacterized membrane protein